MNVTLDITAKGWAWTVTHNGQTARGSSPTETGALREINHAKHTLATTPRPTDAKPKPKHR